MKILLFMPNLGGGGTERAVVNLAKEFSRRGIDVKLVTLEPTADLEADPDAVVCLGFPKSGLRVKRPLYWYGSIRRLIHLMKREQPQALVSFLTGPNYMAAIASLFNRGPRLILSERTVVSTYLKGWLWQFVKVSLGRVYRIADGIIVNSSAIRCDLEALGVNGRKISVIPNPADLDEIVRLSDEPLGELEAFFRGPVICAAGRLEEDKGYPYLLRAFKLLGDDVRLVILGKGSQERELKRLASGLGVEKRVLFAGFQTNPYSFIRRSSVFVLSSLWEGLPNVLIESLAVGTPIVAADCSSGVREVLDNGKFGVIVPSRDSDALADGLLEVLDGGRRFEKTDLIARAGDFSLEKIGTEYLDVILDQVGNDA